MDNQKHTIYLNSDLSNKVELKTLEMQNLNGYCATSIDISRVISAVPLNKTEIICQICKSNADSNAVIVNRNYFSLNLVTDNTLKVLITYY